MTAKKILVAPSFLSANFLNLQNDIDMLNQSEADWFHLDVMDGHFVPNISFGMPIIKQIKKAATKPLDVHLMITEPDRYITDFKNAGADILTVHYEACKHLHRTIQIIRDNHMKVGVSINPHTHIYLLDNIINEVDLILVMSVNPGFGGQKFIENTYLKIEMLKGLIAEKKSKAQIQVDGGVDESNYKKLISVGADILVAGSYIFNAKDPSLNIKKLKTF